MQKAPPSRVTALRERVCSRSRPSNDAPVRKAQAQRFRHSLSYGDASAKSPRLKVSQTLVAGVSASLAAALAHSGDVPGVAKCLLLAGELQVVRAHHLDEIAEAHARRPAEGGAGLAGVTAEVVDL